MQKFVKVKINSGFLLWYTLVYHNYFSVKLFSMKNVHYNPPEKM